MVLQTSLSLSSLKLVTIHPLIVSCSRSYSICSLELVLLSLITSIWPLFVAVGAILTVWKHVVPNIFDQASFIVGEIVFRSVVRHLKKHCCSEVKHYIHSLLIFKGVKRWLIYMYLKSVKECKKNRRYLWFYRSLYSRIKSVVFVCRVVVMMVANWKCLVNSNLNKDAYHVGKKCQYRLLKISLCIALLFYDEKSYWRNAILTTLTNTTQCQCPLLRRRLKL